MIDITNNTFLTYQGSSLGLQPLLANPMPLGGQVASLGQGAGIGLGLTGGTATVWSSAAGTLAYSPNIYALRMDSNLTTANAATLTGTLTVGSNTVTAASTTANLVVGQPITGTGIPAGAIVTSIINGTSFTISFKPSVAGAGVTLTPSYALTLASGGIINTDGASLTSNVNLIVPGSGELVLYSTGGGTKVFSGQIVAGGLTKAGTGDIRIQGDDRGTLTGDVVVSGYNWFRLNSQYALGGDPDNPYAKGNKIILNGGQVYTDSQIYYQSEMVINSDSLFGGNYSIFDKLTINPFSNNDFNTPVVYRSTAGPDLLPR